MNRNLEKNEKIWRRSPSEIETDEVIQNVALLTFNLGVEIGQVAFVISVLGAFWLIAQSLKKLDIESVAWLKKIEAPIAYGIGSIAMFWTIERVSDFGYSTSTAHDHSWINNSAYDVSFSASKTDQFSTILPFS